MVRKKWRTLFNLRTTAGRWAGLDGCFIIVCFLSVCKKPKSNRKATEKDTEKLQTFDFQGFCGFLFGCFGDRKMYRIAEGLACKNRANWLTGRSVGSVWKRDIYPWKTEKPKRISRSPWFSTVWCFSVVFRLLYGGFSETEKRLIFNASQTSSKCLIFNGFTHLFGAGGWVKGRVLSKG